MNAREWIRPAFALVVAVQLAVPAAMIRAHELTLREGQVFKFRTQPVDPADAFRGRYVWLSLEPSAVRTPNAVQWRRGRTAFAVLGPGTNGFAAVTRLERARPAGAPAVRVKTRWADAKKGEVHIAWPGLERYYMPEDQAPAAEKAYQQHSVRTNQACHVTVRIRGAHVVIENLFIEDQPIRVWLDRNKGS